MALITLISTSELTRTLDINFVDIVNVGIRVEPFVHVPNNKK